MEPDIIQYVLDLSKGHFWDPLLLIDEKIYDYPGTAPWKNALLANTSYESIDKLSNKELILLLHRTSWFYGYIIKIFQKGRGDAFYLLPRDSWRSSVEDVFRYSAQYGQFELLKWLTKRFKLTTIDAVLNRNYAFRVAVEYGYLQIAQWLTEQFGLTKSDARSENNYALYFAIAKNRFDILEWMINRFKFDQADILDWHGCFPHPIKDENLELIMWLTKRFDLGKRHFIGNGNRGLQYTASLGQLQALKKMARVFAINRQDICFHDNVVFRHAADYGHLKIVKWLVEYFHLTREDVMTRNYYAIRRAIESGHLEVAQWIAERFNLTKREIIGNGNEMFATAVTNRYFNTVKWIVTHFKMTQKDVYHVINHILRNYERYDRRIVYWLIDHFKLANEHCDDLSLFQIYVTNTKIEIVRI